MIQEHTCEIGLRFAMDNATSGIRVNTGFGFAVMLTEGTLLDLFSLG